MTGTLLSLAQFGIHFAFLSGCVLVGLGILSSVSPYLVHAAFVGAMAFQLSGRDIVLSLQKKVLLTVGIWFAASLVAAFLSPALAAICICEFITYQFLRASSPEYLTLQYMRLGSLAQYWRLGATDRAEPISQESHFGAHPTSSPNAPPFEHPTSKAERRPTASDECLMTDLPEPLRRRREQLREIESQQRAAESKRLSLEKVIATYRTFDIHAARAGLLALHKEQRSIREQLMNAEQVEAGLQQAYRTLRAEHVSWFQLRRYFTPEQAQLRQNMERLKQELLSRQEHIRDLRVRFAHKTNDATSLQNSISNHERFDLIKTEQRHSETQGAEDRLAARRSALSAEVARLEERVKPHLLERHRIKAELDRLDEDVAAADRLNRELDRSKNAFQRREIHQECERRFGEGKPSKVIRERTAKRRGVIDTLSKIERRISEEIKKAARTINHLLIDGNNICYEDDKVIGLVALIALIRELRNRFAVTVIFDASIAKLVKADKSAIKNMIGPHAKVEIAQHGEKADDYLLELAGGDPHTFILGNDRYKEYSDYDAVKSERILRFMIANSCLMVPDLDITVRF